MPDSLDDFLEFDAAAGLDLVKCPHCGANAPRSLLLDDQVQCRECGEMLAPEKCG